MRFMFLVVDLLRGVCRRISEGHRFHGGSGGFYLPNVQMVKVSRV